MVSEESQAFGVPARFGVGSRVAGYVIEEQIGQGGMAVVFRAHDERLDRTVALKILAPALAADEAFRQRFIRESRAAAAVDDPHIIPVFEAGEASGVLFIAMRFVRGGDVRSLIADTGLPGLPSADRVAGIVAQAASALDAAHDRGLVHRDVKPANMLLDTGPSGQDRSEYVSDYVSDHVYLSDFGLSKWALQTTGLTDTGTFLGTLDYIAPEQIEGKPVDGKADQYSLACAAFELLSGSPPFHRQEAMAVMHAQLTQPPPLLTERRADLPPAVNRVFARAMAKVAADRYPTCRQFAIALREALGLGGAGQGGVAGQGAAGHLATQAVVMSAGSLPVGADAALTQAATPPQPVPVQPPVPIPSAFPAQSAFPMPSGAGRSRSRVHPVLLVGASIVVAAGIVAAAIIVRSPKSTPSDLGAASNPPAGSRPSTAAPGQVKPSASPAGEGSTGTAGGTGSGARQASQTTNGQAGFRQGDVLNPGAAGSITSVTWNPAGTLVATSDKNGSTYVWDVTAGRQTVPPLAGPGDAFAAAFSPDGTELATGYSNGTTYLWDYRTGKLLAILRDPGPASGKEVDSVAFSPDGRTLATGDGNGYTNLWKVLVGARGVRLVASFADPVGVGVFSVVFSSRGTLATGDYDGHVYIWDAASGTTTATFALAGGGCPTTICAAVSALAFSGDGHMLAAGNESGAAELWSLPARAGSPVDPPAAAAGQSIWGFSFSGSALLAMGDADGHAYLYRIAGGGPTASIAGALADPNSGSQGVGTLAFSADGRYLVTGDTNGNAYLWRAG